VFVQFDSPVHAAASVPHLVSADIPS
jgi:hypothetical protein